MKIGTIISASYIELFNNYFRKSIPDDITDIRIFFETEFYGSNFGSEEGKKCGVNKLILINEMIKSSEDGEIILYTDADVIFNREANLTAKCIELIKDSDNDILFQKEHNGGFNTGVILIKVNERSRKVFDDLEKERDQCFACSYNELEYMNRKFSESNGAIKYGVVSESVFCAQHLIGLSRDHWILFHCTCWSSWEEKRTCFNEIIGSNGVKLKDK